MLNMKSFVAALGFILLFAWSAIAQDVVAPADNEDLNAFDQALSEAKHKFSEQKKNSTEGESAKNQNRYMEQKKNGTAGEANGEGEKAMVREKDQIRKSLKDGSAQDPTKTKEQSKKAVKSQKDKAKAVSEEAKKMKQTGEEMLEQNRERIRNEYRKGETNGAVNSYGSDATMGGKDQIPDAGKKPETAGTPGSGNGQQVGK